MPPEPPIRGRWTITPGRHITHEHGDYSWTMTEVRPNPPEGGEPFEVVLVPDEAAIERGAKEIAKGRIPDDTAWGDSALGWSEADRRYCRETALAVLRAALEAPEE